MLRSLLLISTLIRLLFKIVLWVVLCHSVCVLFCSPVSTWILIHVGLSYSATWRRLTTLLLKDIKALYIWKIITAGKYHTDIKRRRIFVVITIGNFMIFQTDKLQSSSILFWACWERNVNVFVRLSRWKKKNHWKYNVYKLIILKRTIWCTDVGLRPFDGG